MWSQTAENSSLILFCCQHGVTRKCWVGLVGNTIDFTACNVYVLVMFMTNISRATAVKLLQNDEKSARVFIIYISSYKLLLLSS